jgi:glycerophosphoryl diester phosphodiesterase
MRRKLVTSLVGLAVVLALAYGSLAALSMPVPDHPFFESEKPLVIAHQGGEQLFPSNTMLAFAGAVEMGVDVLELDIHATADDVIVAIHDDTVDRTTDGSGRISELAFSELAQLDAGYYWTGDEGQTFPFRGQGITIPSLKEIFTAFPNMPMNIEIKQESPSIVSSFCRLLSEFGKGEQVLVASFHQTTIEEFRAQCTGVATSMVESEIRLLYGLNLARLGAIFRAPGHAIQIPEYSGDLHVATESFVRAAHAHNVEVHVWTVNEVEDMQRLLDVGVDGIITDRPDRLLELVNSNGP